MKMARQKIIPLLLALGLFTLPPSPEIGAGMAVRAQDSFQTLEDAVSEEAVVSGPCGVQPITIAAMPWPSAAILSEIHAQLLSTHFGCEVRVMPGDMAASASSMATTGQPAAAPEMWIGRVADIWNSGVRAQKLRPAAPSYLEESFEGWFVPDYVVANYPELKTVSSLKDHWQVFAVSQASTGTLVSCPPDWGCALLNRNMLKANGLDGLFSVVEPTSRYELDALIAAAVSRREPILFYYWQPNAVLSQFGFTALDAGPFDKEAFTCLGRRECSDPQPSAFAPEPVVTALAEWMFVDVPAVAAYFQRARMPLAEMNLLLAAYNEEGATAQSVARQFIEARAAVWRPWIGIL